jgi:hypothetical protein
VNKTATALAAAAALGVLAAPATAGAVVPRLLLDTRTPTALTVFANPPGSLELDATLATAAGPVAGAAVTFTTNGASRVLCVSVTDAGGLAVCDITGAQRTIIRLNGGIWTASFAGDATLAPASRAGHE